MAFFDIPLDLPHAGRIAERIVALLERRVDATDDKYEALVETAEQLSALLWPYSTQEQNPPDDEAREVRERAAILGRLLVDEIERDEVGGDRLGQFVRNLFECLELGEEGAAISLRAGEDPASIQRAQDE